MASIDHIKHQIFEFLTMYSVDSAEIDAQTDLFQAGVLDSLMLMDLVVFIENQWGLLLDASDFSPENFRTIEHIAGLIGSHAIRKSA